MAKDTKASGIEGEATILWKDPEGYRQLCEPFPDTDTANAAINAFIVEMREIRRKHKIANVHIVMCGNVIRGDKEQVFYLSSHHGDETKAEGMTAWAFGQAQADRQRLIGDLHESASIIHKAKSGK